MRTIASRIGLSAGLSLALLGAALASQGPPAPRRLLAGGGSRELQVPASRTWTPTGVRLRAEQFVRIEAEGTIDAAREAAPAAEPDELRLLSGVILKGRCVGLSDTEVRFKTSDSAQAYPRGEVAEIAFGAPGGAPANPAFLKVPPGGRAELKTGLPDPTSPGLALLGRIGEGPPFLVGAGRAFRATGDGELLLGINDGDVSNNSGAWTAFVYSDSATPGTDEPSGPGVPSGDAASGLVTAAEGGTIVVAGGRVTLSFPPGAVDRDTPITVTQFQYPQPLPGGPLCEVYCEPSGLKFKKPGTLRLVVPPLRDPEDVSVYSLSTANEPARSGAGVSLCRRMPGSTFEAGTRTVSVPVEHFSWFVFGDEEPMYLVFDLPGKYLHKGDILATLSDREPGKGAYWWMGHVGLYLGTRDPTSTQNDGKTIIESQVRDASAGYPRHGVQFSTLQNFATYASTDQHLYMGARRPLPSRYPKLTDDQRTMIAAYACELEARKVGFAHIGWLPMELPFDNLFSTIGDGINCVGLVERAYQSAGVYVIPAFFSKQILLHRPLWSPIGEFVNTAPVNEVAVETGETLQMQVKGVAKERLFPLLYLGRLGAGYYDNARFFKFAVSEVAGSESATAVQEALKSRRASLEPDGTFRFTPDSKETGKTLAFRFAVDDQKFGRGRREETLFVRVREREERSPVWVLKPGFPVIDEYKTKGKGEEVVDGGKMPPFQFYETHEYTAMEEKRRACRHRMVIRDQPIYDWRYEWTVKGDVPRVIRPGQGLSITISGSAVAAQDSRYQPSDTFQIYTGGALYLEKTESSGPNDGPLTVGWLKDKLQPRAERTYHFKVDERSLDTKLSLSVDLMAKYEYEKKLLTPKELQEYLGSR